MTKPAPPFSPKAVQAADRLQPLVVEGRRPVLLLVEDNKTNQLLGKRLLEHLGCEVDVVADGAAAMGSVGNRAYDLVLMDLSMPVMDGAEATRRLRARGVSVPIVALTATPAEREALQADGFNGCLTKPVSAAALRAAIARTLASSLSRREG
jgi:two-component system capsular synthesis sensor histidine kinase RcsC